MLTLWAGNRLGDCSGALRLNSLDVREEHLEKSFPFLFLSPAIVHCGGFCISSDAANLRKGENVMIKITQELLEQMESQHQAS